MHYGLTPIGNDLLIYYYSLTSYSIGILLSIITGRFFITYCILSVIVIITPLTLLFTDFKNITVNYIYLIICPLINGIIGTYHGYSLSHLFNINKIFVGEDRLGNIVRNIEKDKNLCCCIELDEIELGPYYGFKKKIHVYSTTKNMVISFFIILLSLTYYFDITIPFFVYHKLYYYIRFPVHLTISFIILLLSYFFGKYLFLIYMIPGIISITTILSTRLIISNIEYKIWYNFLLFMIHTIIIYFIYFIIFQGIKFFISKYFRYNQNDDDLELIEIAKNTTPYEEITT